MSMSVIYFSAKCVKLLFVCFYSVGVPGADLTNDDAIKELLKVFAAVWSISIFCKDIGKAPVAGVPYSQRDEWSYLLFCVEVNFLSHVFLFC